MRHLTTLFLSLLLFTSFAFSQNGGQQASNNILKVQFAGATSVESQFLITSLAACTESVSYRYRQGNGSFSVTKDFSLDAYQSQVVSVPLTGEIIFEVKAEQNCSEPDNGWIELTAGGGGGTPGPLPLAFTSINGNLSGGKIFLKWSVVENESAIKFDVEKSLNGKDFTSIETVLGTGTSGPGSYSFTQSVIENKMMYRVKLYDVNGSVRYSRILLFQGGPLKGLKILSNPIGNTLTFTFNSITSEPGLLFVRDVNGRTLVRNKIDIASGNNLFSTDATGLRSGVYFLNIITGSINLYTKIVK